jgi:predicted DNA-binding transcriptional regulator AlpA
MNDTISKTTINEREFCQAVGISRVTAWRLRMAGKLPHCRVGTRVLYLPRHLEEFLASCERPVREPYRIRVRTVSGKNG